MKKIEWIGLILTWLALLGVGILDESYYCHLTVLLGIGASMTFTSFIIRKINLNNKGD